MKIRKISVENFKSYKKLEIDFNKLNYIIGGNASGKSNFVSILKFFSDIIEYGIDDAILLQGGIKYLYNINSKRSSYLKFYVKLEFEEKENRMRKYLPVEKGMYLPKRLDYTLKIKPNEKGEGYRIASESITVDFEQFLKQNDDLKKVGNFKLNLDKDSNGKIHDNIDKRKFNDDYEVMGISFLIRYAKNEDTLINSFFSTFELLYMRHSKIKIYNFDVNLLKSPSSIVARNELEENGSNLVNIIQQLLKSKSSKNKLNKLLRTVLPFVDDINIENNVNKSVFFKLKETYNNKEFPSYMLSDGTVNILAVIVALYFQDDSEIIILEEPERNIHPKLLGKLVSLLEDVSSQKQIFVTTHNPYIIKEANLNDIVLVSRNDKGISNISKPINDKNIMTFLENDLGIEDLFADGILK